MKVFGQQEIARNVEGAGGGAAAPAAPGAGAATPAGPSGAAAPVAPVNPFTGAPAGAAPAAPASGTPAPTPSTPPAGATYFPDKLPEHLRGTSDKETIDKLWASASGLREEMAKRGSVPEKPDGYKLELGEDLAKVFGDPTKDPGTQIFRNLAAKHKLTAEQASGLYKDWHADLLAQGVYKPLDIGVEAKKLLGSDANGLSIDQVKAKAGARWNDAVTWVDGMIASKALSPELGVLAKAIAETADGIQLLETWKGGMRETGLQPGGQIAGSVTKEQLDQRNNDPRGNPMDPRFEPAFERQTQEMFRAFYGARN